MLFVDSVKRGFLYNPVTSHVVAIPQFSPSTKNIMWDQADSGVFVTVDATEFWVYTYSAVTINGQQIAKLGPLEIR